MNAQTKEKAELLLKNTQAKIEHLEKLWDKYDDDCRFVEKTQLERELESLYAEEMNIKNFLSTDKQQTTNNKQQIK